MPQDEFTLQLFLTNTAYIPIVNLSPTTATHVSYLQSGMSIMGLNTDSVIHKQHTKHRAMHSAPHTDTAPSCFHYLGPGSSTKRTTPSDDPQRPAQISTYSITYSLSCYTELRFLPHFDFITSHFGQMYRADGFHNLSQLSRPLIKCSVN